MPVSGNTRVISVGEQVAKGTPVASPTVHFPLSGDAAMSPGREIITLPETDASSQRADNEVVGASPGGGWSFWWRDSAALLIAEAIQGVIAAGVATPQQAQPYYTIWDTIPGEQCTKYDDCRFGQLTVAGQSLQGVTATVENVLALKATLGATPPTIVLPTDRKFAYPHVKVTVGGVWAGTHDSFSITVNRNLSYLRGDRGLDIYDTWPGIYEVTGQLVRTMEDDTDYRKVHGGAAASTALTTAIFTEALEIRLDDTIASNVAVFDSNAIEYTSVTQPVAVDGAPVLQTLEFNTKRQAAIADNLTITIT